MTDTLLASESNVGWDTLGSEALHNKRNCKQDGLVYLLSGLVDKKKRLLLDAHEQEEALVGELREKNSIIASLQKEIISLKQTLRNKDGNFSLVTYRLVRAEEALKLYMENRINLPIAPTVIISSPQREAILIHSKKLESVHDTLLRTKFSDSKDQFFPNIVATAVEHTNKLTHELPSRSKDEHLIHSTPMSSSNQVPTSPIDHLTTSTASTKQLLIGFLNTSTKESQISPKKSLAGDVFPKYPSEKTTKGTLKCYSLEDRDEGEETDGDSSLLEDDDDNDDEEEETVLVAEEKRIAGVRSHSFSSSTAATAMIDQPGNHATRVDPMKSLIKSFLKVNLPSPPDRHPSPRPTHPVPSHYTATSQPPHQQQQQQSTTQNLATSLPPRHSESQGSFNIYQRMLSGTSKGREMDTIAAIASTQKTSNNAQIPADNTPQTGRAYFNSFSRNHNNYDSSSKGPQEVENNFSIMSPNSFQQAISKMRSENNRIRTDIQRFKGTVEVQYIHLFVCLNC